MKTGGKTRSIMRHSVRAHEPGFEAGYAAARRILAKYASPARLIPSKLSVEAVSGTVRRGLSANTKSNGMPVGPVPASTNVSGPGPPVPETSLSQIRNVGCEKVIILCNNEFSGSPKPFEAGAL